MYRNAHHELTIITMYSVSKYDGTGKCRLPEMIETIATRTDFEIRSLVLIYQSYNAVKLDAKCSAAQLRDAIDARLTKDLPYEEIMTLKDLTFEELMVYQSCLPRHTNLYTHPLFLTRAHTHTHTNAITHTHTLPREFAPTGAENRGIREGMRSAENLFDSIFLASLSLRCQGSQIGDTRSAILIAMCSCDPNGSP